MTCLTAVTRTESLKPILLIKKNQLALAGVVQRMEHSLQTEGSPVWFPVRAHAWAVGHIPSTGSTRGNHTSMFLSLSFSFFSPLSKNE